MKNKTELLNKMFSYTTPIAGYGIYKTDSGEEKRMVWGYATTESTDADGEIITREAIEKALPDYLVWRNIREMHSNIASGNLTDYKWDEKGLYIWCEITDDGSWKKVVKGTLKAFSIGGRKVRKMGNKIMELVLGEISLVDRPNNKDCSMDGFGKPAFAECYKIYQQKEQNTKEDCVMDKFMEIKKRMSDVGLIGQVIENLAWLKSALEQEAMSEGEEPAFAEKIKNIQSRLAELGVAIASEAESEIKAGTEVEKVEKVEAPAVEVEPGVAPVVPSEPVVESVVVPVEVPAVAPVETPAVEVKPEEPKVEAKSEEVIIKAVASEDLQKVLGVVDALKAEIETIKNSMPLYKEGHQAIETITKQEDGMPLDVKTPAERTDTFSLIKDSLKNPKRGF